jgi:hypothetical protein
MNGDAFFLFFDFTARQVDKSSQSFATSNRADSGFVVMQMQTYRFVAFFFAAYVVHVRVHLSVQIFERTLCAPHGRAWRLCIDVAQSTADRLSTMCS